MLIDMTLSAFADQTAARSPTPGGGSVAAYLAAMGTALGTMAARFTQGRKGFETHEAALAAEIARLEALRRDCTRLVDDDSRSYDKVTAAYALPKDTDAQKAARTAAIQAALTEAMQTPLATCRAAVEALAVLDALSHHVNANLGSDVAVGGYALGAGFRGAWVNVLINLASIKDETLRQRVRGEGEELGARAARLEAQVSRTILATISS